MTLTSASQDQSDCKLQGPCQPSHTAGELESESSITSVAGEKLREVQAAAKHQQALASGLIKAGELAYICRPLAYVIALRMWGPVSCMLPTKQFLV